MSPNTEISRPLDLASERENEKTLKEFLKSKGLTVDPRDLSDLSVVLSNSSGFRPRTVVETSSSRNIPPPIPATAVDLAEKPDYSKVVVLKPNPNFTTEGSEPSLIAELKPLQWEDMDNSSPNPTLNCLSSCATPVTTYTIYKDNENKGYYRIYYGNGRFNIFKTIDECKEWAEKTHYKDKVIQFLNTTFYKW